MKEKYILVAFVNAKTVTARAAAALNNIETELRELDDYHRAHNIEYTEAYWRSWYATMDYLAKTRRRQRLQAAYDAAVAAEAAARQRWLDAAAKMTAEQLRALRMKF